MRTNKAGCLDQCEHGPTVVVYPEQVWYGYVRPSDVDEIVQEHLVGGRAVERLRLAEGCVNTSVCPHRVPGVMNSLLKVCADHTVTRFPHVLYFEEDQ